MKVLVIDDDPTTQKVMEMFLRKSGYTPVLFTDAIKGLEAAIAPDAPMILVLDWMMPGLDGPVLCKKLREAKLTRRPYVIFLSGRNKKEEVAAGLDAGADDFVTKPFNILEMQARLRVARRNVEHQLELLRMADELQMLKNRNDLLGELMSGNSSPAPLPEPRSSEKIAPKAADSGLSNTGPARPTNLAADETPKPNADASVVKSPEVKPAESNSPDANVAGLFVLNAQETGYVISTALIETRLALQAATVSTTDFSFGAGDCCAWASVMAASKQVWLDVLFATSNVSAGALFEVALRRKHKSGDELLAFFSEVGRVVSRRIAQMFIGAGEDVSQPLASRAAYITSDSTLPTLPSAKQTFVLKIENVAARFVIVRQFCASRRLDVESLREGDILAEQFPRREVSEVPIFNQGVALTPRFLDKLNFHMEKSQVGADIEVFRPSPLAQFFLNK